MSYSPSDIPATGGAPFRRWLTDELRKVSQAFAQLDNLDLVPLAAEPQKFATGLIIYADGVTYDPGSGEGLYYRDSSPAWVFTGGAGGGGVTDHGALTGLLDDDHTIYLLDGAGRSPPQSLIGGLIAGETLVLRGSASSPDVGIIEQRSPMHVTYDTTSNTTPAESFAVTFDPTVTISALYVGGYLSTVYDFTVNTGVYVPATFSDTSITRINAAPVFAAYTWCNILNTIQNLGNFNLPASLVMNIGQVAARTTPGTSVQASMIGQSFSPQIRATVAGAIMNRTTQIAVRLSPTHSTVAGSTVNYGTIIGIDVLSPALALFQTQNGTELMDAIRVIRVPNITFGGVSRIINVIDSALNAATNVRCINHTGTARSDFGGDLAITADVTGMLLGASDDVRLFHAAANFFAIQFNSAGAANGFDDQFQVSNPAADRILINQAAADHEFNINCNRFSIGAQIGAVGNQIGVFVAPARTITIGGEFTQFLLTQAGNLTVDANVSAFAWTINAPTFTAGTGTLTDAAALNVGGNPNLGVNRYGVRIISNPSGGAGENEALRITTGRTRTADFFHDGTNLGFYSTAPIAKQLAVPVTAAGIHAALVAVGLIT